MTGLALRESYEAYLPRLGVALEDGQRELVRVGLDGRAPKPLDPDWTSPVLGLGPRIFGFEGAPPLSALRVFGVVGGVRGGKSLIAGAGYAVYSAANAYVPSDHLAEGEHLYCSFIAPVKTKAVETMAYAVGMILADEGLRARIVGRVPDSPNCEQMHFRATGGGLIKFIAIAAGAGNINAAGRYHLCNTTDEYGKLKSGTYKVNDKDIFDGVRNRLWRKAGDRFGRMQVLGSPWAKEGHLWELYERNYWTPIECVLAQASTDQLRTDPHVLAEMLELRGIAEKTGTLDVFSRDFGAQFMALGSVRIYDEDTLKRCPRSKRGDVKPGDVIVVGIDLGFSHDHAAIVVWRIRWQHVVAPGETEPRLVKTYAIIDYDEVAPEKGVRPRPSVICRRFAAMMRRYGAEYAMADQHYLLTLQEELDKPGEDDDGRELPPIECVPAPKDNIEPHMRLASLMADGRVSILQDGRLLHQMTLPQRRPSGAKKWELVMPRKRGQGHADVAQAAAVGAWQADGTEVPEPPPAYGSHDHQRAELKKLKAQLVAQQREKEQGSW